MMFLDSLVFGARRGPSRLSPQVRGGPLKFSGFSFSISSSKLKRGIMFARVMKFLLVVGALAAVFLLSGTELGRRIYYKIRGGVYTVSHQDSPRAGSYADAAQCRENLREIERAKRKAAEQKGMTTGALTVQEVEAAMGHKIPRCPSGGRYAINPILMMPSCSIGTQANLDPKDDHFLEFY